MQKQNNHPIIIVHFENNLKVFYHQKIIHNYIITIDSLTI